MTKPLHVNIYGSNFKIAFLYGMCKPAAFFPRSLPFIFFFLSFSFYSAFAATKTWTGATNSDWNTGSNWGGTAPAVGDIANIPGGLTNYPVINNSVTIATVNINSAGSGASITVTTGGTFNVTSLITVNANGSFIQNGGTSNVAAFTTNSLVTFSGGTILSSGTLTINNGGTVNQSGGLIHMAVNTGTNPTDNLLIATGGTYNQSDGTLYIKDWAAGGGTFNQTGANAIFRLFRDWKPGTGSVFNSTAGTVQFSGSGSGPNFAAGTRQFVNIIVDAGADPLFGFTASSTLPLTGNFTNNNTTLNTSANANFTFNGSSTQTITSAVTGTSNATFGTLVINNSTTVVMASNINISGNLTISNGNFDEGGYLLTRTAAGGAMNMASGTYLTAGGGFPTNFTSVSMSSNTTVEFSGSGTETIPAYNYFNLKSSNTGARILASSGTIGVAGTFTPGTNSYTITGSTINFNGTASQNIPVFNYNNLTSSSNGARTLASSGTTGIAGAFTPGTNSYTITGSTIDYNGSGSQTIAAFTYNNLTSSSSGARILASSGTISVAEIFTPGTNSYTITGSTIDFNGSGAQNIPAFNYNNLTSSSSGSRTLASSGTIGIAGNFTPGTNSYTVTGSTVDFNGSGAQTIGGITYNNLSTSNAGTKSSSGNIIVNGTFTINSPTTFSPSASDVISGSGTLTGTGTIMVTRVTGTPDLNNQYTITNKNISSLGVNYNGAGAQTVNALNYGDLTITTNGTRTVTLANAGTIGISGAFSPTATSTTYVVTNSTVDFNGSSAQSVPAFTFNNLTLSNGNSKSSAGNIVVNNSFTVSAGVIFIPGATHIISGSGTLTGSGEIGVTRITATADFATQYSISNKTLTNLSVDFSGAGAQTINSTLGNYSTLKISGSGIKTLQGAITITSDLIINAGTLDVSATNYGITIGGNFTNNVAAANFTERTGTITFNGSGAQLINGTSATRTFYNMVVAKTAGQTLSTGGSVTTLTVNDFTQTTGNFTAPVTFTVNGNVQLSSGTFSIGTVTVGGNWTNDGGSVNGTSVIFSGTSKTIGGTTATTFPDLNITTGTITLNTSASCIDFNLANNNVNNSFTISNGITLTVNGNAVVNQSAGGTVVHSLNVNGGIFSVSGNLTINVTTSNAGRVARMIITTGTVNVTGDLIVTNALLALNSAIDMSGGAGQLNLYGNFTVNTLITFTPGTSGTVNYLGTGSQSVAAGTQVTYNNLVINKSSGTATLSGAVTVANVTLSQGTFSVSGSNYSITLTGNWTNNGGTFSAGSGDVLLNGTGTIGGTSSTSFADLSVGATSTGYTMSNNNSCSSLIFDASGSTTASFTHSGSAAITISGVVTINQPASNTNRATWNINAGTATVGGTISFPGTNAGDRVAKIVITTGTLNANGGLNFTGGTMPTNKVIDMSGGAGSLNMKGTLTVPASTCTLTAGTSGSIFNYADDASAQTVNYFPVGAYHNLHINTTGSTGASLSAAITTTNVTGNLRVQSGTLSNAAFAVALNNSKTFEVANGATYKMTATTGMVTGTSITKTFGATSTCDYAGTAQTVSLETYGHLTLSGSGVKTLPGSAMTIQGNLTTSGTVTPTTAVSLTIGGNVTLGSGTTFDEGSTTHNVAGNWTNNGATITTGTSTINFNGTAAQTLGGSAAVLSMYNLTISNTSAAVTVNTNTNISNILNMNGSATILTPATTVVFNNAGAAGTITGSGTIQVTRLAATPDYASQYKFTTNTLTNLTVDFAGAGDQTVSAFTYGGLKTSGSGTKTAAGAVVINSSINISSGTILDMVTYVLSGSFTTISGTGTLKTQNTSATPIPSGKTWTFAVYYNSSSAQTIVAANYNDMNGTGGNRTLPSGTTGIAGTFTPGAGTYTTTGSTIDFNGSGAQSIPAFTFEGVTFSGGNTKTAAGNFTVTNALTLGASTTLALSSNNITLTSTSTNTARVAAVPASAAITYGTGRFIIQRYIPGRRKYRLITSSVTTSAGTTLSGGQEGLSIWGNWQNQGNNVSTHAGTIITGGTSGDGFDQHTTNASMYTYDAVNRVYVGFSSANSKNTKYTPLKAGVAYYLFVYGDRINTVYTNTPNYTTLTATGTILTGDQTYNSSSTIPLSNVTDRYTMLGNPFASPIDWASVQRTNLYNTYWGWDPNLNSTGGYVTVSTAGGVTLISPFTGTTGLNQYIQPGQGFFVRTSAPSPVLTIREQDKVSNINLNAFRVTNDIPLVAVNLFYKENGNTVFADGALAAFDGGYSNSVNKEDAEKMLNTDETVAIKNSKKLLSIDARQMPVTGDTLTLNISKINRPKYTLQVFAQKIDTATTHAYLVDIYEKTSTPLSLSDTNYVDFNVNAEPASFSENRFYIVFKKSTMQPVVVEKKTAISVYPNPLKGQLLTIGFTEVNKGLNTIRLVNALGQVIFRQTIEHDGSVTKKTFVLQEKPVPGIYYLQVNNKDQSFNKNLVIE
jgi:hypothetical protein